MGYAWRCQSAESKFAGPLGALQKHTNLFIRCCVFFIRLFIVAKEKKELFSVQMGSPGSMQHVHSQPELRF